MDFGVIALLRYPLSQSDGCQLSQRESQEGAAVSARQVTICRHTYEFIIIGECLYCKKEIGHPGLLEATI